MEVMDALAATSAQKAEHTPEVHPGITDQDVSEAEAGKTVSFGREKRASSVLEGIATERVVFVFGIDKSAAAGALA